MVYQLSKNTYLLTTLKTDIHLSRRPLYTAFKLTQFGSVISSGMVTKQCEQGRTMPNRSALGPANQAGLVRFGYSVSVNIVLTVSNVTNVRRADVQSSQSLPEEDYECHMNNSSPKVRWTALGQTEKCTASLTSGLMKKFILVLHRLIKPRCQ